MSYTSQASLDKSESKGQGRLRHLQDLVTEFQKTQRREYKQQVLANLANFAYDPINYEFFRQLNVLDLFLDVISEEDDDKMVEFAVGGICNCCLEEPNQTFLLKSDCVELLIKCLSSYNEETVLSAATTLIYLITPTSKKTIVNQQTCNFMEQFSHSSNKRLSNLATLFLQDYVYIQ